MIELEKYKIKTKDNFFETYLIDGIEYNIGVDDNGQCFFIQYTKNNKIENYSCGAYNFNYKDDLDAIVIENRIENLSSEELIKFGKLFAHLVSNPLVWKEWLRDDRLYFDGEVYIKDGDTLKTIKNIISGDHKEG